MLKVKTKIELHGIDDQQIEPGKYGAAHIIVKNHSKESRYVVLEVEGKDFVILAEHLNRAIQNACNQPE